MGPLKIRINQKKMKRNWSCPNFFGGFQDSFKLFNKKAVLMLDELVYSKKILQNVSKILYSNYFF